MGLLFVAGDRYCMVWYNTIPMMCDVQSIFDFEKGRYGVGFEEVVLVFNRG